MFAWLANAWRVPELRRRVLFTAGVLSVYRLGSIVPAPGVSQSAIESIFSSGQGSTGALSLLNLFSGSALSHFSLFALGIMPYVTASIIFQLMAVVVPSLERLQKEGEAGMAKITQYTRYTTIGLAAAQATGYAFLFKNLTSSAGNGAAIPNFNVGRVLLIVSTLTAGTALLMWMGEQITKRGVGNGISIIIFASILSYAPAGISGWIGPTSSATAKLFLPIVALGVVVAVVFVMEGQRRIPVQYARRQLGGRDSSANSSTYMPLSVIMAGVIPIIFAAAVLALPQTIGSFKPAWQNWLTANFNYTSWKYLLVEGILIFVFTFFYTSVTFNPVDQADNLRKYNGYIPGIRPGPPTAAYLDRVLSRLTFFGGLFLAVLAVLPSFLINQFHFDPSVYRALGGTSVLIVVGVALQTMRQMESQMVMRHYEGFLR
jgi:preprotein translocase subunit SecY